MSFVEYVKQVWKAGRSGGTPWSPDRLNHMEDGIKSCSDGISELNNNKECKLCSRWKCLECLESSLKNIILFCKINNFTYDISTVLNITIN